MTRGCWSCGAHIPDEARFCSTCGARNEVIVPVAAMPGAIPVAAPVTTVATVPVASPVTRTVPVAVPTAIPTAVPTVRTVAVPTARLPDAGDRRLSFCNRCGVNIPFGDAKAYMGLVMCSDCFEAEPIPKRAMAVPAITYAVMPA